jgi:hypothetical protein
MVSGAVIIGKPIGPGMIRPFSRRDFWDLKQKCSLRLRAEVPVEVAYPYCLGDRERFEYQEGVLVNICCKDNSDFESEGVVWGELVAAAKVVERKEVDFMMGRISRPWYSDLTCEKVCHRDLSGGKLVWKPYMNIVEIYSDVDAGERYVQIVEDLSCKTEGARIELYTKNQGMKVRRDIEVARRFRDNF